jgi:hypothetical protein
MDSQHERNPSEQPGPADATPAPKKRFRLVKLEEQIAPKARFRLEKLEERITPSAGGGSYSPGGPTYLNCLTVAKHCTHHAGSC